MHLVHLTTHLLPPAEVSKASVPTNVVVSENDLCDRLADALPGDTITYHVGMLARDRAPHGSRATPRST